MAEINLSWSWLYSHCSYYSSTEKLLLPSVFREFRTKNKEALVCYGIHRLWLLVCSGDLQRKHQGEGVACHLLVLSCIRSLLRNMGGVTVSSIIISSVISTFLLIKFLRQLSRAEDNKQDSQRLSCHYQCLWDLSEWSDQVFIVKESKLKISRRCWHKASCTKEASISDTFLELEERVEKGFLELFWSL